jgi:hypothetical protein
MEKFTYRCVELHCILCDHSSYSLVRTVAAIVARCHLPISTPPYVLKGYYAMRDIELKIAAGGRVNDDHDGDALQILVRYQTRTLIGVISIQLDKISPLSDLSLHWVSKGVLICVLGTETSVTAGAVISCKSHLKKDSKNLIK